MRKALIACLPAIALVAGIASPATAGGHCYKPVMGRSHHPSHSMHAAYAKAIAAWVRVAESTYDSEFDWYYSGDRTIACKWKTGHDIVCAAAATPCVRD